MRRTANIPPRRQPSLEDVEAARRRLEATLAELQSRRAELLAAFRESFKSATGHDIVSEGETEDSPLAPGVGASTAADSSKTSSASRDGASHATGPGSVLPTTLEHEHCGAVGQIVQAAAGSQEPHGHAGDAPAPSNPDGQARSDPEAPSTSPYAVKTEPALETRESANSTTHTESKADGETAHRDNEAQSTSAGPSNAAAAASASATATSKAVATVNASTAKDAALLAAASKTVQRHISLLHRYNAIKDVGQGLLGLIAEQRGVRIVDVMDEFGVAAGD